VLCVDKEAVFAASAAERRAVADLLESLDEAALATPSLCAGWDVRTVGAHLAQAITASVLPFLLRSIRYGSFDRANDEMSRRAAQRPVTDIVATLRAAADSPFSPPGTGPRAPLTDVLVHSGDMRRPLGLPHDPPPERVRTALEFLTGPRTFGFVPRGAQRGLRLVAPDVDFAFGSGPEVRGRAADLMMALCGRGSVLMQLSGDGVAVLAARLT
jgi:uncharacterized protein (TIGR03083 family)